MNICNYLNFSKKKGFFVKITSCVNFKKLFRYEGSSVILWFFEFLAYILKNNNALAKISMGFSFWKKITRLRVPTLVLDDSYTPNKWKKSRLGVGPSAIGRALNRGIHSHIIWPSKFNFEWSPYSPDLAFFQIFQSWRKCLADKRFGSYYEIITQRNPCSGNLI